MRIINENIMKTKEEILKEATKRTLNINEGSPLHDAVMKAMEEYAQEQVKLFCQPVVEEQSEQLVCPNCDGEGFSGKGTNEILPCLSCFGSGEKADYDFVRDKAQKETIELLAKTLIEVRKHMTAHIPEKVFDMVDDALSKSGFQHSIQHHNKNKR